MRLRARGVEFNCLSILGIGCYVSDGWDFFRIWIHHLIPQMLLYDCNIMGLRSRKL